MLFKNLQHFLVCPECRIGRLEYVDYKFITSCCKKTYNIRDGQIIIFDTYLSAIPSVKTRDKQADKYLKHAKFPTQISIIRSWMSSLPSDLLSGLVLDLGCGPGPYTKMLVELGFDNVFAVDSSIDSLIINKEICSKYDKNVIYMLQDVRNIQFPENSVSALVMADFLQHIIGQKDREQFLIKVFKSLKSGGVFFLSFFNINIKNYLKNDISGSFSNGSIKYERLDYKEVISSFPDNIIIDKIIPMNIFNDSLYDKLVCYLPFSKFFSRMIVIQGRKV
tara:strand:+ start:252 stop:1085 length:834 start_codon:yes stop_codon:yes gene_type:complete